MAFPFFTTMFAVTQQSCIRVRDSSRPFNQSIFWSANDCTAVAWFPNPAEKNSSSKNFPSGYTQFQDLRNVLANSDQKYTRASMKFVALD